MSIEQVKKGDELTQSLDIVNDNIARLKELFPEVLTEGKIDFKVLQDILGKEIEDEEEYYRFTWAGKAQARREAHKPSTGTLRPCKEESADWDTTENLYIEGDNLEVLKLLQKSYNNKVKMIYIDPPYNTGKDFVYKDNYKDNLKNYQQLTGQVDDEGNKLFTNSDSDGRYHSNWLNMIYPRLKLARNLLKEDGVIFMSIDDNEVDNLRKVCDEVFGEENFIEQLIWKCRAGGGADSKFFSNDHEYILCYSKNVNSVERFYTDYTEEQLKKFQYKDEKGNYFIKTLEMPEALGKRPNLQYPIKAPDDSLIQNKREGIDYTWVISESEFFKYKEKNLIEFKNTNGKWMVYRKYHIDKGDGETRKTKPRSILDKVALTANGSKELKSLFYSDTENKLFDNPKPVDLISYFLKIIPAKNDFILDFFSGSATSAHAIMQINALDGGKRKFIQVQLPETTEEKSEAYKAEYKKITDIGKERIRRAGKKIIIEGTEKLNNLKAKNSLLQEDQEEIKNIQSIIDSLDTGFKVFKLDSSNIKGWDGNPDNLLDNLFDSQDNIKTGRTEEDVLFEILLKYGLDLTLPIEEKLIEEKKVFSVGFGALFICLANGITNKVAEGIGQWKEELNPETCRVIFKDSGFGDVEKTNSVQTLKRFGINEIKSI